MEPSNATRGAYYFLTKGKKLVTVEMALSFLAYNLKRAINILGTKEILKLLRERKSPGKVQNEVFA